VAASHKVKLFQTAVSEVSDALWSDRRRSY